MYCKLAHPMLLLRRQRLSLRRRLTASRCSFRTIYWTDSEVALEERVDEFDSWEIEDSSELLISRTDHDELFLKIDLSGLSALALERGGGEVSLAYLGS